MRFALGATRLRVVRQLIVEGALIALAGAVAGSPWRVAAMRSWRRLSTRTDPIVLDVALDWRMASFNGVIVGRRARLRDRAGSPGPARPLTATGRADRRRRQVAAREVLVAIQIAMSVVLVSAALLFVLTFRNLTTMDVGFARADILMANVFLSEEHHPADTRAAFQRALTNRLPRSQALPGSRTRRRRRSAVRLGHDRALAHRLTARLRTKSHGTRSAMAISP